jgi:pimeloyl-ACP methyl ester carboxylesterase
MQSSPELQPKHDRVGDLDFAYLEIGTGPLALLMHGFPDTPYGWVPYMEQLASDGYHAVAPFARGYAPTAVPASGFSPIQGWVSDIIAFGRHFKATAESGSVLIGHDWGAIATYGAASSVPELWGSVVTASIPPMAVTATRMGEYEQMKMFWYQYFFQQPTAELAVKANDFAFIKNLWADWSPSYDALDALVRVRAAFADGANLSAALSTYRCLYDQTKTNEYSEYGFSAFMPHPQRTLYLHGANDGCMYVGDTDAIAAALPEGSRVKVVDNAGHFLQYEQPEVVGAHIRTFLAG